MAVSKADRQYWINFIKHRMQERVDAAKEERAEEFEALEAQAKAAVDTTEFGQACMQALAIKEKIDRLEKQMKQIREENDLPFYVNDAYKSKIRAAFLNLSEDLLAEMGFGNLREQMDAVEAQLRMATTDARLAASVNALLKGMGYAIPEIEIG
jgi:FtsZ-binding cell division protein ZapB